MTQEPSEIYDEIVTYRDDRGYVDPWELAKILANVEKKLNQIDKLLNQLTSISEEQ